MLIGVKDKYCMYNKVIKLKTLELPKKSAAHYSKLSIQIESINTQNSFSLSYCKQSSLINKYLEVSLAIESYKIKGM